MGYDVPMNVHRAASTNVLPNGLISLGEDEGLA